MNPKGGQKQPQVLKDSKGDSKMKQEERRLMFDGQDLEYYKEITLEDGKDFLYSIWEDDTSDEFESEEEHAQFLEGIENIDNWEELDERLQLCEYFIYPSIETMKEEWGEQA